MEIQPLSMFCAAIMGLHSMSLIIFWDIELFICLQMWGRNLKIPVQFRFIASRLASQRMLQCFGVLSLCKQKSSLISPRMKKIAWGIIGKLFLSCLVIYYTKPVVNRFFIALGHLQMYVHYALIAYITLIHTYSHWKFQISIYKPKVGLVLLI